MLAVFRAEADEEVAGSFFAAVPGLPGSGARVQAGTAVRAEFAEFPGGHLAPMELPAPFAAGLRDVFGRL